MARKYRAYTDDDVIKLAAESSGMSELLRKLGLRVAGGNFNHMRKTLQRLGLTCDHWNSKKNQAWNKNKQMKDWSAYSKIDSIKPHLVRERGHKCEQCQLSSWQEKPIPLEVEHIDGDRTNNFYENLLLLCCNCHALTSTWRGRKNKL